MSTVHINNLQQDTTYKCTPKCKDQPAIYSMGELVTTVSVGGGRKGIQHKEMRNRNIN